MKNTFFQFKEFKIEQDRTAMKVATDGCLFGAFVSNDLESIRADADVLDIGTGTGLLSLMLAQKNQFLKIDAIEVDEDAAKQAKENFRSSPWSERINLIHADANTFLFDKIYDIIISNPPFYENELRSEDEKKNTAHHGHSLKFDETISLVNKLLKPQGVFYLLLPYKREKDIERMIQKAGLGIELKCQVRQSVDHDQFRIILKGSRVAVKPIMNEISIWNNKKEYTNEFVTLLKDFYLYL